MDANKYIIFFGKSDRPVDKFDVTIARIAIFAVKFTFFLIIAFWVLLMMIF